jgi:hypothetical protein
MNVKLDITKLLGFRISGSPSVGAKTGAKPGAKVGGKPVISTGAKIGSKDGVKPS